MSSAANNNRPCMALRSLVVGLLFGALSSTTASATTVVPPEFPELVNRADFIVRAVVVAVTPIAQTRPDGSSSIHSMVTLEVEKTIAGRVPNPLILDVLGGQIGDREVRVSGAPIYNVGDRAIFFVQGNGKQVHPLVRMMHGFYPVEREANSGRQYMVRANREPLTDASEVSQPIAHGAEGTAGRSTAQIARALSPDEFERKITAQITSAHLRDR